MERGTILKNMHQTRYDVYLVYLYSFGSNANCLKIIKTNFQIELEWECRIYKPSLMNDRNHFPIVGHIDIDDLIKNRVLNAISTNLKSQGEQSNDQE